MTEPMPRGLVRVDPAEVGLTRRRRGRGWSYVDVTGAPIADAEVIARIKALVIPPAWQDVWISPDAQGHIQAVGRTSRRRRGWRPAPS
jgi:DNA topoisomerase IB